MATPLLQEVEGLGILTRKQHNHQVSAIRSLLGQHWHFGGLQTERPPGNVLNLQAFRFPLLPYKVLDDESGNI